MTLPLTHRAAMVEASRRSRNAGTLAERYRWIAVWWRLYAKECANPREPIRYARSQALLAADIAARPEHYAAKPVGLTDWLHSGLAEVAV